MEVINKNKKREKKENSYSESEETEAIGLIRRGPWTVEEDRTLINYIAAHGEGRWNSLARCAGLKRTGKSCRLRWLNYLRPDVRRGNITLEEQLLILQLHCHWGNRWSKIAQYLPGRTDNEIKNYWRTRVQKHAKQLKCDVNSSQFKDTMRYLWMPRLVERIQAAATATANPAAITTTACSAHGYLSDLNQPTSLGSSDHVIHSAFSSNFTPENSSNSSDSSFCSTQVSDLYSLPVNNNDQLVNHDCFRDYAADDSLTSPCGYFNDDQQGMMDFQAPNYSERNGAQYQQQWFVGDGDTTGNLWNVDEDIYFLQQQLSNNI